MKILVTGANGQLGSELKDLSASLEHEFVFSDIDTLDLTRNEEVEAFLKREMPDIIINCAAYTAVDKAEEETEPAYIINQQVPGMLNKHAQMHDCQIIHISTDYVFSGDGNIPLKEEDPTGPKSAYGKSKLAGEEALSGNKNAIIIRTSWLYSSYGNNFLKSMLRLMRERETLGIVFDQTGTPTYAGDLARVIIEIINKTEAPIDPGIYHFSNEGVASWFDLAHEIKIISGSNCELHPIETKDYPLPAQRPVYAVLSKEKIKRALNISIPHWKTSVAKCIEKLQ